MDFGFTPEQEELKSQVRRFLDTECPMDRVRVIMDADEPIDRQLWTKMAELGWHALVVPEEHGGLGLHWEDVVVVAEEMGRSLFPSPFAANTVATRLITSLANAEQKARWLPQIASGEMVATLALTEANGIYSAEGIQLEGKGEGEAIVLNGTKSFVSDGAAANLLLVVCKENGGLSVFGVSADAPGVRVTPLKLVDPTHRAAKVELDGVQVTADDRLGAAGGANEALADAMDCAIVAECAQMVGAADAAVTMATEYAKVRKQFGHPIGRFQGVKHKLAELYVGVESARSLTYYAGWAVDNVAEPARFVSMAKAYASEVLDRAGEECIQIHGAIGFTWECDAHLYYKRGRYCRNLFGSAEQHRERVLRAQGL